MPTKPVLINQHHTSVGSGEMMKNDGLRFAIREGGRTVGAGVVAKVLG
ncbi:hypothetical protein QBX66_25155 [Salmonella enterica subsp. diarizonae serovar 48:i:z]|nr:hypothetical protein QBX66_25155 [Salmonella enterica subsp. diarizonae serovar 48:i:z]